MQYTSRIILDNKLKMIESYVYQDIDTIENWETKELLFVEPMKFEELSDWEPISLGSNWKSTYDHTRLFRTQITLPQSFSGKQVMLVLNLGGEGQVRINGEIISSVTSYVNDDYTTPHLRSRVYIPSKYAAGDTLTIEVEACLNFLEFSYAITLKEQDQFAEYKMKTAFIALVDQDVEQYYFDLRCAVEAMDTFANPMDTLANSNARILDDTVRKIMGSLNSQSFYHKTIYNVINESISQLDLEFDFARFRASIPAARQTLKEGLESIPHQATAMVKFVGQAHIDTAWLWPIKETIRKCGRTFSNVLSLMEKYPEFIFAFSQPQLFAYTEEFYPELFEEVKKKIEDGKIELVGNAWVEMDTNVPSGEALVRQLLYGRQYYLDKFGKASSVFWMPDVFGYSWALPQIMKRSGVDYFFTSKLVNNDTNNFPHSLFMWQGVDGTQILSYLQRINYNGRLNAETLSEIYSLFDQKDVCDSVLMTVGYGDGGGGPSYQMLENAERLKNFPGLPQSEFATSESFFQEAEKVEDKLPVWNDEMYYEFHRGTYSSQADTKKNNRKGELLLRQTEIACSMAHLYLGKPYPTQKLGDIWKIILTNQFHDILPGSSIHQVYLDCDESYRQAFDAATELYNQAIEALTAALSLSDNQIAVWNFLSWTNTAVVEARLKGQFSGIIADDGNTVAATVKQAGDETVFAFEACIPPMSVRVYTATAQQSKQDSTTTNNATTQLLENDYLRVSLDKNGNIISMLDKQSEREVLDTTKLSNLLTIFEDIPHREAAWNIDIEYLNHFWTLQEAESVELVENSAVRSVVRVVRKFNLSTITQDIVLEHNAKRLDFVTHVDWQETQRMLKTAFYADVLATKATYEIQFGAIERPTHWNTSYDRARFEVCGHKWADLSEGLYGVSLLNDCKYGYDIKDNCMRLTLLRSPNYPDPVCDKGTHDFVYSLYPHQGDWRMGNTVQEAYSLNVPLYTATAAPKAETQKLDPFEFVQVNRGNVILDSIKGAEDGNGLIVRVYESQGARCNAHLQLGFTVKEAFECNLMEDIETDITLPNEKRLDFYIKPYEIKTFRLVF